MLNRQSNRKKMLEIKFGESEKETWNSLQQMAKSRKKKYKPAKRKRKPGPKAYNRKIVKFNETAVGHFLYVYAPVHYLMLMEYCRDIKGYGNGRKIKYAILESMAVNSDVEAFKTARFRKALISYKRFGTRVLRKTGWTLEDAVYYSKHSYHIHKSVKECTE